MKILITNDDGIEGVGLKILANWAKKLGEVTVSAPMQQQSAKSHAINFREPIEVHQVPFIDGVTAYAVGSTPADCVRFATLSLDTNFDLILSGINKGFNMGEDILYSGTAACIFEAGLRGYQGIAFSTDPTDFSEAEKRLDEIYDYFVKHDLLSYGNIFNVNIPLNSKGIKWTRQGGAYFNDQFVKLDDTHFHQQGYSIYQHNTDFTLDTDAIMNGYIAITPLSTRRDDKEVYERLAGKTNK